MNEEMANTPVHAAQRRTSSIIIIIICILGGVLIIAAGFLALNFYIRHEELNGGSGKKSCTLEAKICPDGSTVSRQGPNCEFKECPGS